MDTCNDLAKEGYEVVNISDVIDGRYKYDTWEGTNSHGVGRGSTWGAGWGYGYGYSVTDGVIIIARLKQQQPPQQQPQQQDHKAILDRIANSLHQISIQTGAIKKELPGGVEKEDLVAIQNLLLKQQGAVEVLERIAYATNQTSEKLTGINPVLSTPEDD